VHDEVPPRRSWRSCCKGNGQDIFVKPLRRIREPASEAIAGLGLQFALVVAGRVSWRASLRS
jgi:hypothetical protein